MYFWQVISCNLFLNKNVKIAGKNCKIRKTFWCAVKVKWLTVDLQKDSESTGENGTQVKPVLLAAEIFAVHTANVYSQDTFSQLYESARNAKIVCKCQVE